MQDRKYGVKLESERLRSLFNKARQLFRSIYGFYPPKCKVEFFKSYAGTYVKWAEVKARKASLGIMSMRLDPLMRVNIALEEEFVPDSAILSTYIEEFIHMVKGLEKSRPHDQLFWDMALRCDQFLEGFEWKSKNAHTVAQKMQEIVREKRGRPV